MLSKSVHMKRILLIVIVAIMSTTNTWAQRIGCVHGTMETRAGDVYILPDPFDFNPQKTYRQPVVLVSFSDADFTMADPAAYYNRIFNEEGYNEGMGKGCVADYFREQSGGRCNLQFDIYGPVKVSSQAGGHKSSIYGNSDIREALKILRETEQTDFSIYDWDGDNEVDQVIFVLASYTGNVVSGYIWPNTGRGPSIELPGGITTRHTSISSELWEDNSLCGIGTIIHEFCHALGLPDIYPMSPATSFSTVDEWDLMDGGNYTNKGWCPPNLSAMEKMYLGWATPVELTEPATIKDMKPLSDGGETYIIRSSGNSDEFYLLENRRQKGWDYGCPGNGLLIFHVDYEKKAWANNDVNSSDRHYHYDLFHADGKNYQDWDPNNDGQSTSKWTMENWMRSIYLSTSAYPYYNIETGITNARLTDDSDPAATLFTANAEGKELMGKAITNIEIDDNGNVSFDFMKSDETGVMEIGGDDANIVGWYDLDGRLLSAPPHHPGIYIARYSNGTKKKWFMPIK